MEVKDLSSWEEFVVEADVLRDRLSHRREETDAYVSEICFRGQHDAKWPLATTLERFAPNQLTLLEYFRIIAASKPEIQAHTSRRWELTDFNKFADQCHNYDEISRSEVADYEYMTYLRHHGFPSPLLDWSRSSYVAAFFAFRAALSDSRVAIFVYCEYTGGVKFGGADSPQIRSCGPYVSTHTRHFQQRCTYTICRQFIDSRWSYVSHEKVFSHGNEEQDALWKFTLPSSEREKVLRKLDEFNLNAYALFGSEDALAETMAFREFARRR